MKRIILMCALFSVSSARADEWRPYIFSVEGDTLGKKHAAFESGVGYNGVTGTGGGLQPDDAHRVQSWLAAAVGVTDWLELSGGLQFADNVGQNFGFSQAFVDARARVLKREHFALSLGAGYQADALLQNAITGIIAASAWVGRLDLTLDLRAAHYFHSGRDPVDVYVTFGAMVRATSWLSGGVEYVGEELEATFGDDADVGGYGRHYVGPTAALRFYGGRIRVTATGGAVFMRGQAGPLARASFAYLF